jgi:cytochrome bd-type quinol oxidase subunit 2
VRVGVGGGDTTVSTTIIVFWDGPFCFLLLLATALVFLAFPNSYCTVQAEEKMADG